MMIMRMYYGLMDVMDRQKGCGEAGLLFKKFQNAKISNIPCFQTTDLPDGVSEGTITGDFVGFLVGFLVGLFVGDLVGFLLGGGVMGGGVIIPMGPKSSAFRVRNVNNLLQNDASTRPSPAAPAAAACVLSNVHAVMQRSSNSGVMRVIVGCIYPA
mmetsp:Transcript_1007/g.1524  ORF Transcript_1007/g.1524 Transcript_1007/m.1524 type:complete len:156 (+) Transcript_1007:3538-4005(+)